KTPEEGKKMGRKKKLPEGLSVVFEAIRGRQGERGIFGIEDEADEAARQTKLQRMAERIAAYDRGYEGGRRRGPHCWQWQSYKGEQARELAFECGTLTVQRAYYVCLACGQMSFPLDEKLNKSTLDGKCYSRRLT